MVRFGFPANVFVFCLAIILGGAGCGRSVTVGKVTSKSWYNLRTIGMAYGQATINLDHPPKNKEELMPFLKPPPNPDNPEAATLKPEDILRSPVDGEEFVIHWGLDFRTFNMGGDPAKLPVLAYEKHSHDGKRLVLQGRTVTEVTDDQLSELPFPKGFNPP
jgi:hypothetical protein